MVYGKIPPRPGAAVDTEYAITTEAEAVTDGATYRDAMCLLYQPFRSFADLDYDQLIASCSLTTYRRIENHQLMHRF